MPQQLLKGLINMLRWQIISCFKFGEIESQFFSLQTEIIKNRAGANLMEVEGRKNISAWTCQGRSGVECLSTLDGNGQIEVLKWRRPVCPRDNCTSWQFPEHAQETLPTAFNIYYTRLKNWLLPKEYSVAFFQKAVKIAGSFNSNGMSITKLKKNVKRLNHKL